MSDRPMNSPLLKTPTTPKTSYVLLSNISWDHLEKLDVDLQGAGARLTYLDKILEIISPLSPSSSSHLARHYPYARIMKI